MRSVNDELLLNVAVISATLLGLLVVGAFFYVETGLRRLERTREVFAPYIRAAVRLTMAFYALALAVSLALTALEPPWVRAVFGLAGLAVLLSTADYAIRGRALGRLVGTSAWSVPQEILTWGWIVAVLAVPWVLGGLAPTREDLTWGILLALFAGLISTFSILLSVFDISRFENAVRDPDEG
jgi:hypothetical protein